MKYNKKHKEGRTYKNITAEYGVSKASICKWCSELREKCPTDSQTKDDYNPMKENLHLKRDDEERKKEVAFLKKATVSSTKEINQRLIDPLTVIREDPASADSCNGWESAHVTQSMSQAGYPYDNAPMERYFNTLENGCTNLYGFRTGKNCTRPWRVQSS